MGQLSKNWNELTLYGRIYERTNLDQWEASQNKAQRRDSAIEEVKFEKTSKSWVSLKLFLCENKIRIFNIFRMLWRLSNALNFINWMIFSVIYRWTVKNFLLIFNSVSFHFYVFILILLCVIFLVLSLQLSKKNSI